MTSKYTRVQKSNRAEVTNAKIAIRNMLEGFIKEDKAGTIAMLNSVRPIDVIEHLLARKLTREEGALYLQGLSDIPVELLGAFRIGKVWQDLKQTSRKYLQGTGVENKKEIVTKFRIFLHGIETRSRVK